VFCPVGRGKIFPNKLFRYMITKILVTDKVFGFWFLVFGFWFFTFILPFINKIYKKQRPKTKTKNQIK